MLSIAKANLNCYSISLRYNLQYEGILLYPIWRYVLISKIIKTSPNEQ